METHGITRVIQCDLCSTSFLTDDELKVHVELLHTNLSCFKCEICSETANSLNKLKEHVKYTHNLTCSDCWKVCENSQELNHHISQCLNERKRKRMETSLLLDETCDKCDKLIESNTKLEDQISLSHGVNENHLREFTKLQAKFNEITEDLKKKEEDVIALDMKLKNADHEKETLKLDMEKKDLENLGFKNDIKALKRELEMKDVNDIITEKNEEIERGKLIIQEKEKIIKKLKETHKKDLKEVLTTYIQGIKMVEK